VTPPIPASSIYANGKQRFAVPLKPYRARILIGPEPFDLAKPLGVRFCPQHVKTGRQAFDYGFGFDPHPRHSYPKINITAMQLDFRSGSLPDLNRRLRRCPSIGPVLLHDLTFCTLRSS
jgi:hypothetical protein